MSGLVKLYASRGAPFEGVAAGVDSLNAVMAEVASWDPDLGPWEALNVRAGHDLSSKGGVRKLVITEGLPDHFLGAAQCKYGVEIRKADAESSKEIRLHFGFDAKERRLAKAPGCWVSMTVAPGDETLWRGRLERISRAIDCDVAWVGCASSRDGQRAGWLTLTKATLSPDEAYETSSLGPWTFVRAHRGAPEADDSASIAGVHRVIAALDGVARDSLANPNERVPLQPSRATYMHSPGVEQQPSAPPAVQQPGSVPVRAAPTSGAATADPDETLPFVALGPIGSPTPFSGSTTPERLASIKAQAAIRDSPSAADEGNETLFVRSPLVADSGPGTSFGEQLTPTAVPVLSIDEYARFRALLRLHGEDHAPTWREFGILSRAAKEAVQARFAAYFQRDKEAQAEFVARVAQHTQKQNQK